MFKHKLKKGGSWNFIAWLTRSAIRDWDRVDYRNLNSGFRVIKEKKL